MLSDDQRAMLRLLAQREEGYEDIAALMGIGVDEVRARVRQALVGLDEDAPTAGPVAAGGPPPPAVAEASSGAVPPATPPAEEEPAPTPRRAAAPPPTRRPRAKPVSKRPPRSDRRRLGELVGGAVVVLLVVLFATGAIDIGGGDSESSSNTTATSEAPPEGESTTAAGSARLTQAVLAPVDGGDASGQALFGRFKKNVLLQVTAEGLDPSPQGESYAVWLARSAKAMVPVGTAKVDASGKLVARFPVPAAVLVLLARGAFDEIALTWTSDATLAAAIARAKKKGQEPAYTGTDVLRGRVTGPFVKG